MMGNSWGELMPAGQVMHPCDWDGRSTPLCHLACFAYHTINPWRTIFSRVLYQTIWLNHTIFCLLMVVSRGFWGPTKQVSRLQANSFASAPCGRSESVSKSTSFQMPDSTARILWARSTSHSHTARWQRNLASCSASSWHEAVLDDFPHDLT